MNNYQNWLSSPFVSNKEKEILKQYSAEEIECYFKPTPMKFGTAGIRNVMGPGTNLLNKFTYRQLTHGYAKFILENKPIGAHVIIAHDNRKNGIEYSQECARVLTSFGIKVSYFHDNELLATPIVSYLIKKLGLDGGIIITASHNTKEYNGFKVYNSTGGQVCTDESNKIESYFPSNDTILDNVYIMNESLINYLEKGVLNDYYNAAKECLIKTQPSEDKNFPIIFTAHCGTASYTMKEFLQTLGYSNVCKVEEQCVPDEDFKNSPCANPEEVSSFEMSIKLAEEKNAKIILGVDPDADRLAIVVKDSNDKWRYLTGNETGCAMAYYIFKNKTFNREKFVISTYISTTLIDRIAKDFNAEIIRTSTGFKWLAKALEENYKSKDFVIAFEEAIGSLNSSINRDKDSFQAAALLLEMYYELSKDNMTITDLLEKEIYPKYGYWTGKTVSYTIKDLNWKEKAENIINYFKEYREPLFEGVEVVSNNWVEEGNYLNIEFQKDISIKMRMSGTEPKYKFYIDAYSDSLESSFELLEKIIKKIEDIQMNI